MISVMLQRPGAIISSENIEIVTNPGIWVDFANHDYPHGWNIFRHVARRTNHRTRDWKRYFHDYYELASSRGMPGGIPKQYSTNSLIVKLTCRNWLSFLALGVLGDYGNRVHYFFVSAKFPSNTHGEL